MEFGNVLIIIFLSYYTIYFFQISISKNYKKTIQDKNIVLENLRGKKIKTLKEQKNFINLKYPKKIKQKWTVKRIGYVVLYILIFILIYQIYNFLFLKIGLVIKLWIAIIFVMVAPIIFNMILQRYNLQKSDLNIYLR